MTIAINGTSGITFPNSSVQSVAASGGILSDQTVSTSSTWTKPTGASYSNDDYVYFFITGGGGAGGRVRYSAVDTIMAYGGNSGTTIIVGIRYDNCPSSGTVTIGAGGTGTTISSNSYGQGSDGSDTSIVLNSQTFTGNGGKGGRAYSAGSGYSTPEPNNYQGAYGTSIVQGGIQTTQGNYADSNIGTTVFLSAQTADYRALFYGPGNPLATPTVYVSKAAAGGGSAYLDSSNNLVTNNSGRSFISAFDSGGGAGAAAVSGAVTASNATKYGGGGGAACGRNSSVTSGSGYAGCVRVLITKGQINDPILYLHDTAICMARLFY